MRPVFVLYFFITTLLFSVNLQAQSWTQKPDIPTGRMRAISFMLNGRVYVAGGNYLNDVWVYDPASNSWAQKNNLPGASSRTGGISFVINGKAYIGLGADYNSNDFRKDLWEYDAVGDAWTQKKDFPDIGREGAACFVVNNKAYVVGGSETQRFGTVWEYDPANDAWTKKANYPAVVVTDAQAFTIGNKGYVTGGDATISSVITKKTYAYEPSTNMWTNKAEYPGQARQGGVAFVVNGMAYCGLGHEVSISGKYKDFYVYNAATDTWTSTGDFSGPGRWGAIGVSDGSKAYVGFGFSDERDFWEYSLFPAGIADIKNEDVVCYPNPVNDVLEVRQENPTYNRFTLYNVSGQKVLESALGKGDARILAAGVAPGMYYYVLSGRGATGKKGSVVIAR